MSDIASSASESGLAPVSRSERIHALDIIRGFALIGIFLMNVEWFTRPITFLGTGVDASQTGIDYAASWFVYTFVQGKFWTLFSLLFGMGFAVMLTRAERADRAFMTPYLRRIAGLLLFGSAHFVLIWTGDILHDYAVTAFALLLITSRSWKIWAGVFVSVAVAGVAMQLTGHESLMQAAGMTAFVLLVVALLMFFLNRKNASLSRYYKWGASLYSVFFALGLLGWVVMSAAPQLMPKETAQDVQKRHEQFDERMAERAKDAAEETRIFTTGTYAESVVFRGEKYMEELPRSAGLSMLALPMFLIGFWFVRSGVMADWRRHLPMFRRLASWTLPLGLAMTLTSVLLHPSSTPSPDRNLTSMITGILFQWAMLPMCIGYFSTLICLLGTSIGEKVLSPLRFAGQMALTNYLCASLIGTWYFSGYGLGHYGQVGRAGQVLFVAVVFSLQLIFSYFWLAKFRYGPMEWLWRAITYWQLPPMLRRAGD